jgi:hypothetical protein
MALMVCGADTVIGPEYSVESEDDAAGAAPSVV